MIYHQIRFSVKPDAPKDQLDHALELLRRVGRELDVVESWCVGRDVGGEFDYGALYVLKDIDAYHTYLHAPLHRQTDEAGLPLVDNMISMDLTDDEDSAIGDKIREMHANRFANDAGLRDLVDGLGSYKGSGTENSPTSQMPTSTAPQNLAVVRAVYTALDKGDAAGMTKHLHPEITWTVAAGLPNGGTYVGPQAVLEMFAALTLVWDSFRAVTAEFFAQGDVVIVLGSYHGVNRKTGKTVDARFAHVWRLRDRIVRRFETINDSHLIVAAMEITQ